MSEQRNIIILGASFAGIGSTHYILTHLLPALNAQHEAKYHLYIISPSPDFYYRIGSPRTATSTSLLPQEKLFYPLADAFKRYPASDFTLIQATATSLDTNGRFVCFKRHDSSTTEEESLPYHALIVATGSRTPHPAYSMHTSTEATKIAIKETNTRVKFAKSIIIVGGGPTGVEAAGEIGEFLNGKPGWFSTPTPKVDITLITADSLLLPALRPAIGKEAERQLGKLGVKVLYDRRVVDVSTLKSNSEDEKTILTLSKGEKLETDLYIPAHGVLPNSEWLPKNLLNEKGYLETNKSTLRVDRAGPLIYALGDVASYSRNNALDISDALPTLMINLKRDLLSYSPSTPNATIKGRDRVFQPLMKETQFVPIGSGGGVGAAFGWRVPSWMVWLAKGRDYMLGMAVPGYVEGSNFKKEHKWSVDEAVV